MLSRYLLAATKRLQHTPVRTFTSLPIIDVSALTSLDQVLPQARTPAHTRSIDST